MTIRKLHSHNTTSTRASIAKDYTELYFDDTTNTILLPDPTGLLETKIGAVSSSGNGTASGTYLVSTNAVGDEGGEVQLAKPPNGTLSGGVTIDAYQNKLRIFEQGGSARGVSIDLTKAPAGVGAELVWKASGYVDAGQFVTLDNLKFTVTTGGQRGLTVAAVTGTVNLMISGTFGYVSGVGGSATTQAFTYTTTPNMTGSWFGWSFPNQGDGSVYLVNDVTNYRFYRVTLMIGPGYTKNFICIERLH